MHDVYVSGIGIISPIGYGPQGFWQALSAGLSGVRNVTRFDTQWLPVRIAAEVPEWDPEQRISDGEKREMGTADIAAVAAGRMALADAGLAASGEPVDYFLGTTAGRMHDYVVRMKSHHDAPASQQPALREGLARDALREHVTYGWLRRSAGWLGAAGRQTLVINACAAGSYAIALAAERIRRGEAARALCGGVDVLCEAFYVGFSSLRSLAPDCCRPFDRDRKGLVLGEAAAVLLLESGESLAGRRGRAWAKLAGYGWSCDGFHMSQPHPEGVGSVLAMQRALADAGLAPGEIGAFVAHGTGTPSNDLVEAQAIRRVFGGHAPAVTAPKSMLGHSLGAASAAEAIAGILMLHHQAVPPIVNLVHQDPACPVDCVTEQSRPLALRACMTNSTGFGGNNATLIFTRPDEAAKAQPARRRPSRQEHVAVTGLAAISSLGTSTASALGRLLSAESGIAVAGLADGKNRRVGAVSGDLAALLGGRGWRNTMRASLMACWACRQVLEDSGTRLDLTVAPEDLGIVAASDFNSWFVPPFEEALRLKDLRLYNPSVFLNLSTNAVPSQAAMFLQTRGFVMTLCSGPIAGLEAIAAAGQALTSGRAKIMLAGGSQEMVPEVVDGLRLAFRDPEADAPEGAGLILAGAAPGEIIGGEGCGIVQLETLDHAQARGARVRARLRGYGQGFDPRADEEARPVAAGQAIQEALQRAGLEPEAIGAVFLASNGNPVQDRAEARALAGLFQKPLPAAAIKSSLGETLHAAGSLAVVFAIQCLEQGVLPPTLGALQPAWADHLLLASRARACDATRVLILMLEHNRKAAALILEKP